MPFFPFKNSHDIVGCKSYCSHLRLLFQGHTLRLLSLPDFLDASIGKILKVRVPLNPFLGRFVHCSFYELVEAMYCYYAHCRFLLETNCCLSWQLKKKIQSAASAIKSVFGQGDGPDKAVSTVPALHTCSIAAKSPTIVAVFLLNSHLDLIDWQTDKLEALKERMIMVREIFRNKETTEFVIVTIPTVSTHKKPPLCTVLYSQR